MCAVSADLYQRLHSSYLSHTPELELGRQSGDRWRSASHGNLTPTWFSRWPPSLRDPISLWGYDWTGGSLFCPMVFAPCRQPAYISNDLIPLALYRGLRACYTCSHRVRKYLTAVYSIFTLRKYYRIQQDTPDVNDFFRQWDWTMGMEYSITKTIWEEAKQK